MVNVECLKKNKKFLDLWKGNWEKYFQSQSEADLSFCRIIHNCGGTKEDIDCLMRYSGLMRPKWNELRGEKTYGEITIEKVMKC